jgi:glycosyltransferase involved in cell wall biosynthesis
MKIGYYIHHTSLKAGGIFTYSIGILKLLIKSDEIEKIYLIISPDQEKYFLKIIDSPKIKCEVVDRKNLIVNARFAISYLLSNAVALYRNFFEKPARLKLLSRLSVLLNPYSKYITRSQIDLLHVPQQYSPIYKSNHIIVSFDHIKHDLLKYFDVKESKISICPPPFTEDWFLSKKLTSAEELKNKFHVENEFLLYPAATWKHKNHFNLFKALSLLNDEGLKAQLICTGNKTDYFEDLQKEIVELGLNDQVKFLGIVSEEDLIGLYKRASLVVIPTLYEAGSGPLYEAMRYSVPVICSDVTSLPDTMGAKKYIFNPNNINEIASLIKKMLQKKNFRSENLNNSAERLLSLGKVDYTQKFINVYKKLMSSE